MLRVQLVLAFVALSCGTRVINKDLDEHWGIFKDHHGKVYFSDEEETKRRGIWEDTLEYIRVHNLEYDMGKHTYFLGMNEFTDWTHEEFVNSMTGFLRPDRTEGSYGVHETPANFQAPATVDWRTEGMVTPVQNQGACRSGWAFSTTGTVEGQWKKKTGKLPNLSEQNLVDCAGGVYMNMGCIAGLPTFALNYVYANGIDSETSYPYVGKDAVCKMNFSESAIGARVTGQMFTQSYSEASLASAVATVGPVAVVIDSKHPSFQSYKGGIYYEPMCQPVNLDHAMLVVGYGPGYWIVKNSMGTSFGENGYIRMAKDRGNNCGIASCGVFPIV